MDDDEYTTSKMGDIKLEEGANGARVKQERSASILTPNDSNDGSRSPHAEDESAKSRSGSAENSTATKPKLSRRASQKLAAGREPTLFNHLPDATANSCEIFQLIPDCLYGSKHLGSTDNDSLDCECREDWRMFITLSPPLSPPFLVTDVH